MSDLNGDAAVFCKCVHFVHFAFECLIDFDSQTVVALDVGVAVSHQVTVTTAAAAGGATALSAGISAAHAARIRS